MEGVERCFVCVCERDYGHAGGYELMWSGCRVMDMGRDDTVVEKRVWDCLRRVYGVVMAFFVVSTARAEKVRETGVRSNLF